MPILAPERSRHTLAIEIGYAGGQLIVLALSVAILIGLIVITLRARNKSDWLGPTFFIILMLFMANVLFFSGRTEAEAVERDLTGQGFRVQSVNTDEQTVVVTNADGKAITFHYQDHDGQYRPYAKDYLTAVELKGGSR